MKASARIYYGDSYMTRFDARVVAVSGNRVYLDRTAFYPTSGGQPFDTGFLGEARVVDVVDEELAVAHVVDGGPPAVGAEAVCSIDWARRHDHMQQHSGQHLLSAALEGLYGVKTVSFHLGVDSSTIDVDAPALNAEKIAALERRANELIEENRGLGILYEDATEAAGLRKATERQGTLRIITIEGLDRSACGGTHVRATGEIGALLIRKTEKIRNTTRIEFLCGMRAVRRARMDYDALVLVARTFSAPLDQTPGLVAAQTSRLVESEKARQKLELTLAAEAGRALYRGAEPTENGIRFAAETVQAMDDIVRARSNGFVQGHRAAYLATCPAGPSYLLAVSGDAVIGAIEVMKPVLEQFGGKGGGTMGMSQGRLGAPDRMAEFEEAVRARIRDSRR